MGRKKKRRSKRNRGGLFSQLPEGARRGLLFVGLLAVAALILLSAFGLAGIAGVYIDQFMALIFGWTRLIVALAVLVIGFGVITPNSERIGVWTYIGLGLSFLSGTAFINLFALKDSELSEELLAASGGYVGLILQQAGVYSVGFWGTFALLIALLLISVILLFHGSWEDILELFTREYEDEYDEEGGDVEDEEVEEEEYEEEAVEIAPKKKRISLKELTAARSKKKIKAISEDAVLTRKRKGKYELPIDLLDDVPVSPDSGDIERNSEIIHDTFANFNIETDVVDVSIGPTITQFAMRPASGVKLSRIVGLQNDLALALAAHPIRIEAPIPGKSLVGIEVPNKKIATVCLRTIIESPEFKRSDSALTVSLGMDVTGKSWTMGLEKAPHMLVAGATGSGKSVCLNNIIVSLLYQHGPESLKMIMVDPKRVELPAYAGIPHLLVPPIIKPDDAINALKWTVREMERRLDVLSAAGARNIASYNKKAEEQMPYIVFIIDELSDLMGQASRDVEALIVRIAQMARAVGIHLVLATQRPSVDVITGTIKANIPTRISFAVASQTDSRTILDHAGAEKLLGRGDMLYMSPSLSKARRMQGAYLSDDEIKAVVNALKDEEAPDYNYEILEVQKGGGSVLGNDKDDNDPLMDDAIEVILEAGKASTSLLQRRIKIGYSRAARIMDLLEEQGVIGPARGSKPREILIDSSDEIGAEEYEDAVPLGDDDEEVFEDDEEDVEVHEDYESEEEEEEEEDDRIAF